jgi:replicative DNA helicase
MITQTRTETIKNIPLRITSEFVVEEAQNLLMETESKPGDDLPHDFEIEMGLLATLLANNAAVEKVAETLEPEHFADSRHGRIYDAIRRLAIAGRQANALTLRAYFQHDDSLTDVGGATYLARLQAAAVTLINASDYAERIIDLFRRRALIALGNELVDRARRFALDETSLDQIAAAETSLFELAERGRMNGGPIAFVKALGSAIDIAELAFRRESATTGVTTGFNRIDRILGGLQRSDLVILAGRPAMGKTALATNIAFNAARARLAWRDKAIVDGLDTADVGAEGAVVAFFSLEMSADQLANRILAERSGVPSDKIRRGEVNADDFVAFAQAANEMTRLPLYIDDTPGLTVSALRTRARRMVRTPSLGLGLIVVDYLQLLSSPTGSRSENRVQEISAITRGLKMLAKELGVPVLALSQLSRAVEMRDDKRPQLADLRESGTIEQDADVVMFVYRDEYYHQQSKPQPRPSETQSAFNDRFQLWQERAEEMAGKAEVIVAKHRHGSTGIVELGFEAVLTKFSDLA